MEEKDIELLLKEFSTRLPYGVVFNAFGKDEKLKELSTVIAFVNGGTLNDKYAIQHCKPYLRPMSSMAEEEKEELKNLFDAEEVTSYSICYIEGGTLVEYLSPIPYSFCYKIIDWLNKNMFDYRGLIPKGLAIAVTKENNPYKD